MPSKPRCQLVDPSVTCYYHVTSRCVRQAFLLLANDKSRKNFLYHQMKRLHEAFAVDVCAFSFMNNHLHLILRLDPQTAAGWSDREVVERWGRIHPPRDGTHRTSGSTEDWIDERLTDEGWVAQTRQKLSSLSQFIKDLKQPVAVRANREDEVTGHFWEGRFKSVPLRDEQAVLAVSAYVDLNPFSAGVCQTPEQGEYTSLRERAQDYQRARCEVNKRHLGPQKSCSRKPKQSTSPHAIDERVWFVPIGDRPTNTSQPPAIQSQPRRGLIRGLTLENYLKLVDGVARLVREGKHRLSATTASILDRLKIEPDRFLSQLNHLLRRGSLPLRQ